MASVQDAVGETTQRPIPALTVIDAEGYVIGWTQGAEELLGYAPEEILGRPGAELLMPDELRGRIWDWSGGTGDAEYRTGLFELRRRDGGRMLARVEISRLATVDGTASWIVSTTPAEAGVTSMSVLRPLLSLAPIIVAVWDRDLRCAWMNDGARRVRDILPGFAIGRGLREVEPGRDTPAIVQLAEEVLERGTPVIDCESFWPGSGDGGDGGRSLSVSLFRVEGVDRRPLGVCLLAIDITHSKARHRLALLREASVKVGTTLDVRRTAQELADLAVPVLADYVTVDLAESILPEVEPLDRLPPSGMRIPAFYRAGMASIHEGIPEALWRRGEPVYVPPSSPFTAALHSGRPHFEPEMNTSPGTWLDRDPDRARLIRETGMHSLIVVPLKARGEILGVTVLVRTETQAPFSRDDLLLAEELAATAALSLDNARRYTRERNAALLLQRHLLPSRVSGGDALEVSSLYRPSGSRRTASGDWFDVISLTRSRIALVVGEVTGQGLTAAASMGRLRTAIRTLTDLDLPPHELLTRLDDVYAREAKENGAAGSPEGIMEGTVLYAIYDPFLRRCTMASAGHPPPAIVDPSGRVVFPELPAGPPIGMGLGSHESIHHDVSGGTLLALYTDGLIGGRDSDPGTGMERLGAALAQASGPLDSLCSTLIDTMVHDGTTDDVTVLLVRTL
ncbi:SpoIIE family protein phosphatase [Actinomadura sp. SCN-SB]|uniref:SpoIIE family protein phosphatase n=1 Tax=Actinomadura sp. SCN-SB TaxID=3373092 RepID=UPI0037508E94